MVIALLHLLKYFTILLLIPIAYCSIPFHDVFSISLEVSKNDGKNIDGSLKAVFLDKNNKEITTINSKHPESSSALLVWWVHSKYPEKSNNISPDHALKAVRVVISAKNCTDKEIPLNVISDFEPLSFSPHGGGPAYMYHHLNQKIILDCSE